jgi:hypothetical protein
LERQVLQHPSQPLAPLSEFFLFGRLLCHLSQGVDNLLLAIWKKAVVSHFEIELILEEGSHQAGDVIISDLFAEAELGQVGVVIALGIVLHEFPELLNVDMFLKPVSLLLSLSQLAQKLLPGALNRDGGGGDEDGSLGREIHLAIGRGQEVQPRPVVLKAEGDDKVSMINVFDDSSLMHVR